MSSPPNLCPPHPNFPFRGKTGYSIPFPLILKTHTASPEEPSTALQLGEDIHHLAPVYIQEAAIRGHVVLKGHSHGDRIWRRRRNDSNINIDQQSKPSAPCPSSLTLTAAFLIRTQLPLSQLGHVTISPAGPWENRQEDGTKEYWGPHHRGLRMTK